MGSKMNCAITVIFACLHSIYGGFSLGEFIRSVEGCREVRAIYAGILSLILANEWNPKWLSSH